MASEAPKTVFSTCRFAVAQSVHYMVTGYPPYITLRPQGNCLSSDFVIVEYVKLPWSFEIMKNSRGMLNCVWHTAGTCQGRNGNEGLHANSNKSQQPTTSKSFNHAIQFYFIHQNLVLAVSTNLQLRIYYNQVHESTTVPCRDAHCSPATPLPNHLDLVPVRTIIMCDFI